MTDMGLQRSYRVCRDAKKSRNNPWSLGLCGSRYGYKEWGNIGCFGNPIVYCSTFVYRIVEMFSLIRGCRHGWLNYVKTSCIFM